jgi:hypothetical protein
LPLRPATDKPEDSQKHGAREGIEQLRRGELVER